LETFVQLKRFVDDPGFHGQRQRHLAELDLSVIDAPIVELVDHFAKLPYCFTLQSCYGHFLHSGQQDPCNIEPLPISDTITMVEYRIAYVALCIENSKLGQNLFHALGKIQTIDPKYVQFGCAEWFWQRQVNSYALQVGPERYMRKDKATVNYREALHIEKVRNHFFVRLKKLIQEHIEVH
jgi:hypothetical protein